MSSRVYVVIALLIYVATASFLSIRAALPKKDKIELLTPKITPVDTNLFRSPVISQVRSYTQFGNSPVTVSEEEQGKENPFK